jgi:Na+/H+ antiporter NhaA
MLILNVVYVVLMKKTNSYLTIGIAAGLFTATLVGIGVASYVKYRKKMSKRTIVSEDAEINPVLATEYTEDIIAQ